MSSSQTPRPGSIAHWAIFGQSNTASEKRVVRSDFGIEGAEEPHFFEPIEKPQTAAWEYALTTEALEKILLGFRPQMMEDKWVVLSEGPDDKGVLTTEFVRRWTGQTVAVVRTQMVEGEGKGEAARFVEITWNSETDNEGKRAGTVCQGPGAGCLCLGAWD
jgi:hypothetical protein